MKRNPNLRIITMAEVTDISGDTGNYSVSVKLAPRYVKDSCTACGDCEKAVTTEFDDEHNYGLSQRKGAYIANKMAYPQTYVIDPRMIGTDDATKAKEACKFDAIDLEMQEETVELTAGAVIWSTGWKPYDANKIQPYGYDRFKNVITNVEFERLMDPHGPTGGKLLRPSDGKEAKDVAFIQCAGSRDKNHLAHCSRICCMASLKQSNYVQEKYGHDGKSTVYYIDIRAIDRFEDFYQAVKDNNNISFIKSKVAKIEQDGDQNPVLHGVDTEGYKRYATSHDLVVLATGMEPSVDVSDFPVKLVVNPEGFIEQDDKNGGIFAAGCSSDALDVNRSVQHATASALRAVQVVNQVARSEVQ
jgi:quinone-modifying oxidoreductase subunit QmoA